MKKFINAEIELISFEMTDIITTSNGDVFDGEADENV
jgi:hypothetical protein